jgi:hypothetical protein
VVERPPLEALEDDWRTGSRREADRALRRWRRVEPVL